MTKQRAKSIEQKVRKIAISYQLSNPPITPFCLSLRGEAEAISRLDADSLGSKGEIPRCTRNDRLRSFSNEKGIALVMILILSAIALAIMTGLIYMITTGTQISGMQKKYETAREAGIGGADVTYQLIGARGDPGIPNINFSFSPAFTTACMTDKLNASTSSTNWDGCTNYSNATSLTINPLDNTTYDFRFDLGAFPYPTYRVYAKIVDTVEGNSGGDQGLTGAGVVSSGSGEITVVSRPYLYTIELDAENPDNPSERAKYSILYQY